MTLTISPSALSSALKSAEKIVESRNVLPILSMVRFAAEPQDGGTPPRVTITTTNLDVEYRQVLEAIGSVECCVDAKRLSAWASAASKDITLTLDGHILTAKSGRSRLALPALPIDDFPVMPVSDLGKSMAIDFAPIVKRTLWAASTQPSQAYLSGVLMVAEPSAGTSGKARFVATDGYKMPIVTTSAKWPKGNPEVILPAPLIKAMADVGTGMIEWDASKARFTSGDVVITGKLIDGKFPDHKVQLAKVAGDPYAVDAGEFIEAVRRVRIASDAQQRKLRITKRDGALSIRIEGTSGFEGEDEIEADCTEGFEAGFNADYLVGMLQAADTDSVTIEQDAANSMMRICPTAQGADLKFEGLLWPLRI